MNRRCALSISNVSRTCCTRYTNWKKPCSKSKQSKILSTNGYKKYAHKKTSRLTGSKVSYNRERSHMITTWGKRTKSSKGWRKSLRKWSTSISKTSSITRRISNKFLASSWMDSGRWSGWKMTKLKSCSLKLIEWPNSMNPTDDNCFRKSPFSNKKFTPSKRSPTSSCKIWRTGLSLSTP